MTNLFDSFVETILENSRVVLEKTDLRYASNLDISAVQDLISKNSTNPFVQTFSNEVVANWNQYHTTPKFTMINRTKRGDRMWSFEFGTKRDGYRGFGFQKGPTFYVTDLFSNHRDYDKALMKL